MVSLPIERMSILYALIIWPILKVTLIISNFSFHAQRGEKLLKMIGGDGTRPGWDSLHIFKYWLFLVSIGSSHVSKSAQWFGSSIKAEVLL